MYKLYAILYLRNNFLFMQCTNYREIEGDDMATKDYIDFRDSLTENFKDREIYVGQEWCDEFYGLSKYREYSDDWC